MAAYVKSTDVDLPSNSKFIQVNDGANIGNIREGWPVFINQNLVGFAKVINTSANPPTIELYEIYSGTAITAGNMSTFPSQGAITAIGDRITSLANTYESLSDSVAVNPVANSLVKRTGTGARVKTGNATENDDAVALGQMGTVYDKNVGVEQGNVFEFDSNKGLGKSGYAATWWVQDSSNNLETLSHTQFISSFESSIEGYDGSLGDFPVGVHIHRSDSVKGQFLIGYGGSAGYRTGTGTDTWTPIRKLYDTNNILGTVSQSGGVPTGAIIERGSNANGEYVKYADGTLICWVRLEKSIFLDYTGLSTTVQNLTIHRTNNPNWSYPVGFTGEVELFGQPFYGIGSTSPSFQVLSFGGRGESSVNIQIKGINEGFQAGKNDYENLQNVALLAIGRWY